MISDFRYGYNTALGKDIPRIKRAKGYFLYTENGKRLTDFYQEAGFAVLGHNPQQLSRILKNYASLGTWGTLPAYPLQRISRAVNTLFPAWYPARFFFSPEEICVFFQKQQRSCVLYDSASEYWLHYEPEKGYNVRVYTSEAELLSGTAHCSYPPERIFLWRPFLDGEGNTQKSMGIMDEFSFMIPVIPFPFAPRLLLLCRKTKCVLENPPCAAFLLAAFQRSVYNLLKACATYTLEAVHLPAGWRRRGAYILHGYPKEEYGKLFAYFLKSNVLFPFTWYCPAIIPRGLSKEAQKNLLIHL